MKIIDTQGRDVSRLTNIEPTGRVFRSMLPNVGTTITPQNGTAYFVYLGRTTQSIVPKFVEFWLETVGSGTHTAEIGLFSTPTAPNRNSQTISKIVASALAQSGTEDLVTTGLVRVVRRNSGAYGVSIPSGMHLWAGIRTALGVNQPILGGVCQDFSYGLVLSTTGASALTNSGPWTGVAVSTGSYLHTSTAPDLRVTLD